jgi:two-component sensor histidine kinase
VVDVKSVLERVTRSIGETMLTAGQDITITVSGDRLVLPSREATSLALAASELVQNALKHAFAGRSRGQVQVQLQAGPAESEVLVADNGVGDAHQVSHSRGLGLQIVEALVHDDLKGCFERSASPAGTRALIRFPTPANSGVKP